MKHHRLLVSSLVVHAVLTTVTAQTNWTLRTPTTSPLPFTAHAMAFHLPSDRHVLFGGITGGVRYDQTWLYDGTTWTQATPTTVPPARVAHAMVYDQNRGVLVMFGGVPAAGGLIGDTWEWDGGNWTQRTPTTSPSPRRSFPMVFHPGRGTTVLWGGFTTVDQNDMWEWDGTNWTQINPANSPSPRRASDMAYDPATGNLILFSGFQMGADTWSFDGITWTQLAPAVSPSARFDHSMVTDTARGRIVMFGGPGAADQWEWNGAAGTWLQRTPATLPSARSDTYLSYDLIREEILMFGSVAVPETWRYAPVASAFFATFGNGCAGTLGQAPSLVSSDRPWLAETFDMAITPVPANTIGIVVMGLSNTFSGAVPLPVSLAAIGMPGCDLQVDPVLIGGLLATGTTANWALAIPNDPTLLGGDIYVQGGAFDLGANAAGIIVANHGQLRIGGK